MSQTKKRIPGNGGSEELTVRLPAEIADRLRAFCREKNIPPDLVVERALLDYFREGDVSH
ncbi:MAG: hypothetical protein HZA60_03345 [Deltaproteobacteria bacterium]|nr:hypothetical protein [Deltaproteobacteria bacterium]